MNRMDSGELFGWPNEDEEEEQSAAANADDDAPAHTFSALDFEEQNPFTIGLNDDASNEAASLFVTGTNLLKNDGGFAGWTSATGKSVTSEHIDGNLK